MDLLTNKRIDNLTRETDSIGILDKADFLNDFFISIKNENDLKMFCIYGDWGSGKSTLLKYLENNLEDHYNTFFFEAWEHDHNHNIAYSLLEFLTYSVDDSIEKDLGNVLAVGKEFLKGFGKSLSFELSLPLVGKVGFEPGKMIEQLEEASKSKEQSKSQFQLKKEFKEEFIRLEDRLSKEGKPKKNIVFIDDLDRCDPEQTLALLSAIKLFFTYGEKTLFVCGIDKNAVQDAIRTKYHDYIKSSEYLEKIFDITFSMPKDNEIYKMFEKKFASQIKVSTVEYSNYDLPTVIDDFFKALHIQNPRKIKKVLNKYSVLCLISKRGIASATPNIYIEGSNLTSFSLFETVYVLYLIILHEFHPEVFENTLDIKKKLDNYSEIDSERVVSFFEDDILETYSISKNINEFQKLTGSEFYICFLPHYLTSISHYAFDRYTNALSVSKHEIELYFYNFLFGTLGKDSIGKEAGNISLLGIKDFVGNMM